MKADDTRGRSALTPAATYLWAAVLAAVAGFVAVYVSLGWEGNRAAPPSAETPRAAAVGSAGPLAGRNRGAMAAFVIRPAPQELPAISFADGSGALKSLADWKGKIVLLNLWATWCAPCREEMPALDRLQAALGGEDFDVVAVATDRGSADKPRAFLAELGTAHLALYHDPSARLPATLKSFGMPTTLLLDRRGREIGRLVGPAEWDSADARALIEAAIAARPPDS